MRRLLGMVAARAAGEQVRRRVIGMCLAKGRQARAKIIQIPLVDKEKRPPSPRSLLLEDRRGGWSRGPIEMRRAPPPTVDKAADVAYFCASPVGMKQGKTRQPNAGAREK